MRLFTFIAPLVLALAISWLPKAGYGQTDGFFEGITGSFQHKPTPDLRFDSRNSFITTRVAKIRGLKAGLDFNKTVKVGIGYNWLSSDMIRNRTYLSSTGEQLLADHALKFAYISPYFEYTFFKEKRWEASIPVQLGIGTARYIYTDNLGSDQKTKARGIFLYEPHMTCLYKPIRYAGIGVGTGYRLLLAGNRAMPENFNSPIYVIKFKLMFGEIMQDLKGGSAR